MRTIEIPATRAELSEMLKRMSFNEVEDLLWQLYSIIGASEGKHTVDTKGEEIAVTDKLPENSGDVSIMTIEELYKSLKTTEYSDPSEGYSTSTYPVYAINHIAGIDDSAWSTVGNLKAVGAEWYRQLVRPIKNNTHWNVGSYKLFGGPLSHVNRSDTGKYCFCWYYTDDNYNYSDYCNYWLALVVGSVYVAVVHR